MKKYYSHVCYFLLTIYCIILISLEIHVSQDFVRNFFTDIKGDIPFYAVNTSLSVFLLAATSLIFIVNLATLPQNKKTPNTIRFYRSQIILFAFLACDDRFLIHEYLGHLLNMNDALIILGLGVVEIGLIVGWSNFRRWHRTTITNLFLAAVFLCFMIAIDAFLPREMVPRLSLEDLSKTWSSVFIFSYSWSIFKQNVKALHHAELKSLQVEEIVEPKCKAPAI